MADMGDIELVDEPVELNDEYEGQFIRAKWTMDGAVTLTEAAQKLVAEANRLEQMEREGWQLTGAVEDDYGHIAKPVK